MINGSFEFAVDPAGVATGNPAGPPPDLGLVEDDDPDEDDPELRDRRHHGRGRGGRPGRRLGYDAAAVRARRAVLLVLVIRLVGRRRRA